MCPKEEAIKTLQEDGIVADTRISIDLVKEYFYKPDGEISNAEAMEILKKSIEHPYFLSGGYNGLNCATRFGFTVPPVSV